MSVLGIASVFASLLVAPTTNPNSEVIGYRFETEPVTVTKKVFFDPVLFSAIRDSGRTVRFEIKSKYEAPAPYFIADPSMPEIVSVREIRNDVDSLLYMTRQLESLSSGQGKAAIANDAMGYIRTINRSYDDEAILGQWRLLAGDRPNSFISMVEADHTKGLTFQDFFGQFVCYDSQYNLSGHQSLAESRQRINNPLRLIDPSTSTASIDLIHLFASMDGIYSDTGSTLISGGYGNNHIERDLASWNGDLQQAVKYSNGSGSPFITPEPAFSTIMNNVGFGCSEEDIKADMDAMTITKLYFEGYSSYTISNSLYYYYSRSGQDNWYRPYSFMVSSTLEPENGNIGDLTVDFSREVYREFNISFPSFGDALYYDWISVPMYIMMNGGTTIPTMSSRVFVTRSFVAYVVDGAQKGGLL